MSCMDMSGHDTIATQTLGGILEKQACSSPGTLFTFTCMNTTIWILDSVLTRQVTVRIVYCAVIKTS
jgi:hypothetical protein